MDMISSLLIAAAFVGLALLIRQRYRKLHQGGAPQTQDIGVRGRGSAPGSGARGHGAGAGIRMVPDESAAAAARSVGLGMRSHPVPHTRPVTELGTGGGSRFPVLGPQTEGERAYWARRDVDARVSGMGSAPAPGAAPQNVQPLKHVLRCELRHEATSQAPGGQPTRTYAFDNGTGSRVTLTVRGFGAPYLPKWLLADLWWDPAKHPDRAGLMPSALWGALVRGLRHPVLEAAGVLWNTDQVLKHRAAADPVRAFNLGYARGYGIVGAIDDEKISNQAGAAADAWTRYARIHAPGKYEADGKAFMWFQAGYAAARLTLLGAGALEDSPR